MSPGLSRPLSTSTTSSLTAATWHLLRTHTPPPPLETALSKSLPSPPPPPSLILSSTSSPSDLLLALRFFIWSSTTLHHLSPSSLSSASKLLHLPSHPHLLHSLLDSYLSDSAPVSLKTFKILLSLSHHSHLPFPFALSLLHRITPQFHLHPDLPLFNSLLRLPSASSHQSLQLLRDIRLSGRKPDLVSYVSVIKKLCAEGYFSQARMLLETMESDGCRPNVVVYSALLDGACIAGEIGPAVEILEGMEKGEDTQDRPNVVSYTCLMKWFCEKGRLEEALGVLDRMGRNGVRPNRVMVKTLIGGFCGAGRVEDAYKIVEGLVGEEGSVSSNECYSVLVMSLLGVGDLEGAEGLLRRMLEWGVRPNGVACNELVREVCKRKGVLEGYQWVGVLEENEVNCVDSDIYSSILAGLCEEGHLVEAEKLGRRVVENGVRLEDSCVNSVVQALKKNGDLASQIRRLKEGNDGLNLE